MKTKEKITAIEKAVIEPKLWQYFFEFSKEGIKPKMFKDRQGTPGENGGFYLSIPEYDTNYYKDFFDAFFVKKSNQSNRPYKRFIEHEKLVFEIEFNDLSKDPELPIIDDWIYYLEEKLSLIDPVQAEPHPKEKPKYSAKHYVLAYLFDCDAINESYPIGNKKEIERIGNERMGNGKGNTFYKNFNTIIHYPSFNTKNEAFLIDLVGENWLNIVTELSTDTELLKKHIEKIKTK